MTVKDSRLDEPIRLLLVDDEEGFVNVLANQPGIELMMIGGSLYPQTGVALGPMAVAALEKIHVRRLIMSVGGITEKGLFNSNSLLSTRNYKIIIK